MAVGDQVIPPGLARGGDATGVFVVSWVTARLGRWWGRVAGSVHEQLVAVVDQSVQ